MNLELLISKYLDGDLTPEEDQLLRKIISEQPLARDEFESAALLHVEMQQDADTILPPADIVSETEDLILMKIMNHSIQDSGRPAFLLKIPFGRRLVSVFSVALILLAASIPFKDGSLNILGNGSSLLSADNISTPADANLLKEISSDDKVLKTSFKKNSGARTILASAAVKNNGRLFAEKGTDQAKPENEADAAGSTSSDAGAVFTIPPTITEAMRASSAMAQNTTGSRWAENETEALKENSLKDIGYGAATETNSKDEVQVSTFLATNVLKTTNAAESAISSISQSVSYGINSNDRVGVEMGYTMYTYEGNAMLPVQSSPGKSGGIVIMSAGGNEKPQLPNDGASKPGWSQQEIPYVDQGRMYWGAAFYERQMIRSGNISLHGRVGMGGSGEGGVAYGRVFGKWDFLSVMSFTAGAESRALVKTPASVEKAEVNAAISLMYGLQIRF